jgi:hypothetical protein
MTYHIWNKRHTDWEEGGRNPEFVAEVWPEYAKYLKWYLCSSDGPMHYLANTIYHASDKDCNGKRKGEPFRFKDYIQFLGFPMTFKLGDKFTAWLKNLNGKYDDLTIMSIDHGPDAQGYKFDAKWTFAGYADKWDECPFDSSKEAQEWLTALQNHCHEFISYPTDYGKGKDPDLESARSCAIWQDATLEQLQDKEALEARLPALLEEFKRDVEELGFIF